MLGTVFSGLLLALGLGGVLAAILTRPAPKKKAIAPKAAVATPAPAGLPFDPGIGTGFFPLPGGVGYVPLPLFTDANRPPPSENNPIVETSKDVVN